MTKSIDTLIPDIQSLFDGHDLTPDVLDKFGSNLVEMFRKRFEKYGTEREPDLYLSNVGKPLRQLWFQIKGQQLGMKGEPLRPETKLKFLYGDVLEELLILLAMEAGHEVTDLQKEVEVDGVRGRIDCTIDGVLVDVKSASSFSWTKFHDGSLRQNDPFGYVGQLAGYSRALDNRDGAFLVIDKTLGKLCLAKFSKEELAEYDVEARIPVVREALSKDEPPEEYCYQPKPEGKSGNCVLDVGCSYCDFKHPCWKDANDGRGLRTFLYSTGPKFFTHIEREPNVPEVKN